MISQPSTPTPPNTIVNKPVYLCKKDIDMLRQKLTNSIVDALRHKRQQKINEEQFSIFTAEDYLEYYLKLFENQSLFLTARSTLNIVKILQRGEDNFALIDNGSHMLFDVFIGTAESIKSLISIKNLIIYCYKLDGVSTILNHHWLPYQLWYVTEEEVNEEINRLANEEE